MYLETKSKNKFMRSTIFQTICLIGILAMCACKKNAEPSLAITTLGSTSGEVNTSVAITGTGFNGGVLVKFGEVAAEITEVSPTQLTVKVPNGSTKSKITVAVGSQIATSNEEFTTANYTEGGKSYRLVYVGTQVWFGNNYNGGDVGLCYDNNNNHCTTDGKLYTWAEAQTICPQGWKLPTAADWNTLLAGNTGSQDDINAYNYLATNGASGMNLLLTGYKASNGIFTEKNKSSYYWAAEEANPTAAKTLFFGLTSIAIPCFPQPCIPQMGQIPVANTSNPTQKTTAACVRCLLAN